MQSSPPPRCWQAAPRKSPPPNFENDKVNPAAEGSRVIAVSFAPQTKTTLEGLQPKFVNEKDTILLYTAPEDENEPLLTDTCVVKVDGSGKATIYTDLTGKLRALYPAKAAVLEDNVITAEILAVQTGKFADANIASADIDENNSAQFENVAPLLIITPPSGTKKLIVRSLWTIGEDGQRSRRAFSINTSAEKKEQCTVTVLNPDDDGKYYVALYCDNDVNLSDLSFEAWFDNDGTTGSIKGIPTSKIAQQATALGKEYDAYNEVQYGTAYTIDDKNWHEYVEVGGHKWATMNMGAANENKIGRLYMWGDVIGNPLMDDVEERCTASDADANGYLDNVLAYIDENTGAIIPLTEGRSLPSKAPEIGDPSVLPLQYDAAYANWGGAWRMPTKGEFETLMAVEDKEWRDVYDPAWKRGYYFTENGNTLFFPLSNGGWVEAWWTRFCCFSDAGEYWSSTSKDENTVYGFKFARANSNISGWGDEKVYISTIGNRKYTYEDWGYAVYDSETSIKTIRAIIDEPEKEIHQDDDNEKYKHENPEWFGEE